ncbi:MAG: hypothetical protein EB066_07760 [Betaproteobacteria bacterium]|nr:hypothetical protein [Betaproteobacteria bacterium]
MKKILPLLTPVLGLTLFSLLLATPPTLHAKPKEKPALLCEQAGQMTPCEDSQSDKVADKGKPRAFKAQGSDGVIEKAKPKTKKKKAKTKKTRKTAPVE